MHERLHTNRKLVEAGLAVEHKCWYVHLDIHFFTAPTAGATLDSSVATPVAWASEQEATTAAIDAEEIDKLSIPDAGEYTLAAGALKADKDTPRENSIVLVRTNRVTPAGAIAGSDVRVSVENRVRVIAQPNPAL